MPAFVVRRVLQSVIVVACVVFLVFSMLFLSGDPVLLLLPPDASPEEIAAFSKQMGFDLPFWQQFLKFSGNLLVGDFGRRGASRSLRWASCWNGCRRLSSSRSRRWLCRS